MAATHLDMSKSLYEQQLLSARLINPKADIDNPDDNYTLGLSVSYVLFDGFLSKHQYLAAKLGRFKGVDEFIEKASRGAVKTYNFYSIVHNPMTTCGCCECIAAMLPMCNGIMTVNREYIGETPCGMKFTTLAGVMGGGATSPGFVGHSKFNITQEKVCQR
jgi:CO dehydrogenase/acetyl-CoA synthase beta subunit